MEMAATRDRLANVYEDGLGRALGFDDRALVRVVSSFGLDATCAPLIGWIPTIELAWRRGLTERERERILTLVYQRHGVLGTRAEVLLRDWLARRPADALFRTARRVLRVQLAKLLPHERPAVRARVIGPCAAVAEVSGGLLGFGAVSADEQVWLLALADDLRVPDELI